MPHGFPRQQRGSLGIFLLPSLDWWYFHMQSFKSGLDIIFIQEHKLRLDTAWGNGALLQGIFSCEVVDTEAQEESAPSPCKGGYAN